MPKLRFFLAWIAVSTLGAISLRAQQVCPGLPYLADTPEDELMQAVNGAEKTEDQIAALDKYAKEHGDSKFMPCVEEYYTIANLKLNHVDQVIEHGEKGLSGSYADVMLIMNLTKAYIASGKVGDAVFAALIKAPEQLKAESSPARPPNVADAEWQKSLEDLAAQAKDERAYLEYGFLQLLPRVPDGNKRVQFLDQFVQAYPDSPNAAKVNLNYFLAYQMTNNPAKASEYGEKAVASDPTSLETLNAVADYYAVTLQSNLDKANEDAKKALELATNMKKPEGLSDDQFKSYRDNHLGLAHATLGYVSFLKGTKTHKVAPAIQEFKTAADLLGGNPTLQGRTLYYLGYAYEVLYPPNHRLASEALVRASAIDNPWQGQARTLLAKVKAAAGQ